MHHCADDTSGGQAAIKALALNEQPATRIFMVSETIDSGILVLTVHVHQMDRAERLHAIYNRSSATSM